MTAQPRAKRVVVALDEKFAAHAIGPVYTDEAVEKLRTQVAERGWRVGDVITLQSAAEFRAARGET